MSAVNKAVAMLESLRGQVLKEGEKEAATYDKFACFCKDTTKDKSDSISAGKDEKDELSATIQKLSTERSDLDDEIGELTSDIEVAKKELFASEQSRVQYLKVYEQESVDLTGALQALEAAIKEMKGSKKPSLVQLRAAVETARRVARLAAKFESGKPTRPGSLRRSGAAGRATAALVQQAPDVPMQDYNFHSEGIIETLEMLLASFQDEKTVLDKDKVAEVAEFDSVKQEKTDVIKAKTRALGEAREAKARKQEAVATANGQLTTVAATLIDDQEYLSQLSQMCSDKAKTWDQRSQVRMDELSTLTEAIGLIKGIVSEKTTAATVRFLQRSASLTLAESLARNKQGMEAVEAEAEDADTDADMRVGSPPAFLQRREVHRSLGAAATPRRTQANDGGRQAVVNLLRNKGQQLKSTLLAELAGRIAADPFAKVKKLIQELIERLLQEASHEANHKGWCDKSISDAEQKRDYAADAVEELNGRMSQLEATRDTLSEDLGTLARDIAALEKSQNETTTDREEEQVENANTVTEAEAGLEGLNLCIDILSKFYMAMSKETVDLSLSQRGPAGDAPDAGFENGEAYKGAQSEAGGILGLLDVMKSDFRRTIDETEKAEAQAQRDYTAFMTETGKSLASKNEAASEKGRQKDDAEERLQSADEELGDRTVILQTSIKELLELQPACIDTGMSYADRVAAREEEIEALKRALCILGAYAQYGPDAAGKC